MVADNDLPLAKGLPAAPRKRKVRKGTQSCWECKRRKTRCFFVTPFDSVCAGCKSRDTNCVRQEYHEEASTTRKKCTRPKRTASSVSSSLQHPQRRDRTVLQRSKQSDFTGREAIALSETYHNVYCGFASVWPCDRDLNLIRSCAMQGSGILYGPLHSPYSSLTCRNAISLDDVVQLPSCRAHPVLVARKVLLLSSLLQRLPPHDSVSSPTFGNMADLLLERAIALVTSNDELLHSVEGIECVALESMVHNHRGNLRRALLSLRKAMVLAQLLGLHRNTESPSVEVIEPQTRTRIDFDYIWFRLVASDRYLSLMLGVPQAWTDDAFLEKKELGLCSPMEQLERLLLVVGGRILERNERSVQDLVVTQEIDQLLQCASACMPPQWWMIPDVPRNSVEDSMRTGQIMIQLTHYFLLMQLHFPYLLCSSDRDVYTYSKITAVNASRDILFRFTSLRSDTTFTSYCCGVDFIAFFASAALCLAHIVGSCGNRPSFEDGNGSDAFYYLTHQRVSDRGLVEKTLEHMEQTADSSHDSTACQLAALLRPLLVMEAASRVGAVITTDFTAESEIGSEDRERSGQVSDSGNTLHIVIPHCGKIHVTRIMMDIELLPDLTFQFDSNMECIDPVWVSEATQANNLLNAGSAGTQAPECSNPVEEASQSETHG